MSLGPTPDEWRTIARDLMSQHNTVGLYVRREKTRDTRAGTVAVVETPIPVYYVTQSASEYYGDHGPQHRANKADEIIWIQAEQLRANVGGTEATEEYIEPGYFLDDYFESAVVATGGVEEEVPANLEDFFYFGPWSSITEPAVATARHGGRIDRIVRDARTENVQILWGLVSLESARVT